MTTPQPWSPPMTSTAIRISWPGYGNLPLAAHCSPAPTERSSPGCDGEDLAPLVVPAGRANPVRHVRRRALRASAQLRNGHHAVVRAAHSLTASGRFSFRDTHNL